MIRNLLIFTLGFVYFGQIAEIKAQLVVADGLSPNVLVNNVLTGDNGIEIKNISYTGYDRSIALFENGNSSGLGIDKGIILSSGLAVGAKGPNNEGTYTSGAGGTGSNLLDKYAGAKTIDAAELQFDFRPQTDGVVFNYVFSSEEYIEWVNKGFNDIFGFFVQGPGITGEKNVAIVPNSTLPVSIDNINHLSNSQYFRMNNIPGSVSYKFLQHDAQTVVLEAKIDLIPCEWYTIKMAVADVGDNKWDSWVFIEAQSFKHKTKVGRDTFYCDESFNKTLDAGYPGKRVIWSTADTTQTIKINKFGTYWVEIFTDCGSFKDHITIAPAIQPFSIGRDTIYCGNLPARTLEVEGQVFEKYFWSSGDTTPTIIVKKPGNYNLKVWRYGCSESAAIDLNTKPFPTIELGSDTVVCSGNKIMLTAGSDTLNYKWNDGSSNNTKEVSSGGRFFVTANLNGCIDSDTINVDYREAFLFDLGPRQTVKCSRDITIIDTKLRDTSNYIFDWSNGHKGPYLITDIGGTYWVEVSDKHCDYKQSDTLTLIQYEGGAQYFMPNAFSPNKDEWNNTFGPVHALHSVKSYKLLIYNRWGQLIFHTENEEDKWDGTFNGTPSEPGVYLYICEIRSNCLPDNEQFKKGVFHLLK